MRCKASCTQRSLSESRFSMRLLSRHTPTDVPSTSSVKQRRATVVNLVQLLADLKQQCHTHTHTQCRSQFLQFWRRRGAVAHDQINCARQPRASTVSASSVTASSYSRHANVVTPCLLAPLSIYRLRFSQAPCQHEKAGPLVPIADFCYWRSTLLVSTKFSLVLIASPEFMLARFVTREDLFGHSEASKTNMHCIVLTLSTTSSFDVQMFDGSTDQ